MEERASLKNKMDSKKGQSAMEYLMTYGWAILIIAVILGILFQLGVFSSANFIGTSCEAVPGFLCQSPVTLTTTGALTFTFGQNTGVTIYNVQAACTATTFGGLPYPITSFNSISATGQVLQASQTGNSLAPAQTQTISALPCYASSGASLGSNALTIGQSYSGGIWLNYTTKSSPEVAVTNPWLTVRAANLRLSVS